MTEETDTTDTQTEDADTPEKVAVANQSLEEQLAETAQQAAEYLEGWRKAQAEMINLKRRMEKQREQSEFETRQKLVKGLLGVLDDFDMAASQMPDDIKSNEWVEGMFAIQRKLLTEINNLGVEEIDPTGEKYDPLHHEAIAQVPSDEHESGMIVDVLRKGYVLGDKVIRPAMVRVAQ